MNHDIINATILLVGSGLEWHNVSLLYRHKLVKGVSLQATAFYAAWGMWNCYYFSSLGQWLSVASNVSIMSANLVWLRRNSSTPLLRCVISRVTPRR